MAHRVAKQKKEISGLGEKELRIKTRDLEAHIFQLRMQFKTGQLASTAMMSLARKELARVKTALSSSGKRA